MVIPCGIVTLKQLNKFLFLLQAKAPGKVSLWCSFFSASAFLKGCKKVLRKAVSKEPKRFLSLVQVSFFLRKKSAWGTH